MQDFFIFKLFSRIKFLIFSISIVIFSFSAGLTIDKDYALVCRGGGNTEILIDYLGYGFAGSLIKIRMQGSNISAKERLPNPGYCAWLDRGFRQDELEIRDPWRDIWKTSLQGGYIVLEVPETFSPDIFTLISIDSTKKVSLTSSASTINYLLNSIFQGQIFHLRVKRKYMNVFEIIQIGPFSSITPLEDLKKGQVSPSVPREAQKVAEASLPDLTITGVEQKQDCRIEIIIKNSGAPLQESIYQSNPVILSINEPTPLGRTLARFNLNEVDPQKAFKNTNGETKFIWVIPKNMRPLDKNVRFIVDPDKKIFESNEQNNIYNGHILCQIEFPDKEKKIFKIQPFGR